MSDDCCPSPQFRNSVTVTLHINNVSMSETISLPGDNPRFFAKGVDNALIQCANNFHRMLRGRFGDQE